MATLKFPAIFIDIKGAEVTKDAAKELADRINSAFAMASSETMVSILTDGLVSVMGQLGLSPTQCLALLASAVADKSNIKVHLVKQPAPRETHERGGIRRRRMRH